MVIDGKKIAGQILRRLQSKTLGRTLRLAIVQVGHRPDSDIYIRQKIRAAEQAGIATKQIHLQTRASQKSVASVLQQLSLDPTIHGILVQLPLPSHLDTDRLIQEINPTKDVDGFRTESRAISPLIQAIERCIQESKKKSGLVMILGRTSIFSATLQERLTHQGYTIRVAEAESSIPTITKKADIIISVRGRGPKIFARHLKQGAVVIDAGIRRFENGISGDADASISTVASAYTPVPGGVGPLTVAYALRNVVVVNKK